MSDRPTRRLDVVDLETADADVLAFAHELHSAGERPWFEVWYPNTTADTFDAVEFDPETGGLVTLPPYDQRKG